jgi:hypothetical protein
MSPRLLEVGYKCENIKVNDKGDWRAIFVVV